MKARTVLKTAAGGVGTVALANRLLALRASELEAPLVGNTETYHWRGFEIAYTEAGDPENQDLLVVHGISAAASSREYAEVFDSLAQEYHVVAPDLPGFGRTDRPSLMYSATVYETFLTDVIDDLLEEPKIVASSLTGAYAARVAQQRTVDSLLVINPTTSTMNDQPRPWVRALLRTPLVGTAVYNALVSKPSLRHFHRDHGYADPENLSEETLEYEWRSAHQPGAKYAPASFLAGYLDPEMDLTDTLADLSVPVTLVWGGDAATTPVETGRQIATEADVRLVVFDNCKLLPHVEHAEQFVEVVTGTFDGEGEQSDTDS